MSRLFKKPDNFEAPDYKKLALKVPFERQLGGHILINNEHVADTMKCGHCYTQWIYIKGSGKLRGWCKKCHQVTCGRFECSAICSSPEERLDALEAHLSFEEFIKGLDSKPILFIK